MKNKRAFYIVKMDALIYVFSPGLLYLYWY